jgi:hypothetical protein
MKKKAADIFAKTRLLILNDSFKKVHKTSEEWFTRERIFTFEITFSLVLNLLKKTIQIELYNFLDGRNLPLASKQAFCAARQKISPKAYIDINDLLIKEFYINNDETVKKFLDFCLLIIDGSTLRLPESPSIREEFGACSNGQYKNLIPMARISQIYDPFNGMVLQGIIKSYNSSERSMASEHIKKIISLNLGLKYLIILDRGYPSIALIFFAKENLCDLLIRCPFNFLPAYVQERIQDGECDFEFELRAQKLRGDKRKEFKKLLPTIHITSTMKIRVIVITLNTSEKEYLITSLTDIQKYPYEIFKELYNSRWGVEESYKFIKIHNEMENFSTIIPEVLRQEFHANIFMSNARALLSNEAQEEIEEKTNFCKYEYKINRNISLGLLKNELVNVLFDKEADVEIFCNRIKNLMKKNTIPIRKGRTYVRKRVARRAHHITIRRNL